MFKNCNERDGKNLKDTKPKREIKVNIIPPENVY